MTKPIRVETATEKADMPHAFEGQAPLCVVCSAEPSDVRHISWERWQTASRETAAEERTWEIGS